MKYIKTIGLLLAGLSIGILLPRLWEQSDMPRVHKLQQPLLLTGGASNSPNSLLPAGTSLYYDQAFPEGFVRYIIYVNVEGVKLESHDITEKFWIDPLTALPIDKDRLQLLLENYPLTKSDLAKVLNSSQLSRQEIHELLVEFSE